MSSTGELWLVWLQSNCLFNNLQMKLIRFKPVCVITHKMKFYVGLVIVVHHVNIGMFKFAIIWPSNIFGSHDANVKIDRNVTELGMCYLEH